MTSDRRHSKSPSRSASYSPSPPPSPARENGDQSRQNRGRSRSRSPPHRSEHKRSDQRPDARAVTSVEVSGLTRAVKRSHLEHIFGYYGIIDDIVLPTHRTTLENKGRGWIVYRSSDSAEKAEEYMNGGQIDGVILTVRQADLREEDRRPASSKHRDENSWTSRGQDRSFDRSKRDEWDSRRGYDRADPPRRR